MDTQGLRDTLNRLFIGHLDIPKVFHDFSLRLRQRAFQSRAFCSSKVNLEPNFGKRFLRDIFLDRTKAEPLAKHIKPITINRIPCKMGRNKPTIPRATNAAPTISHLMRARFLKTQKGYAARAASSENNL